MSFPSPQPASFGGDARSARESSRARHSLGSTWPSPRRCEARAKLYVGAHKAVGGGETRTARANHLDAITSVAPLLSIYRPRRSQACGTT